MTFELKILFGVPPSDGLAVSTPESIIAIEIPVPL